MAATPIVTAWLPWLAVVLAVVCTVLVMALVRTRRRFARSRARGSLMEQQSTRLLESIHDDITFLDRDLKIVWSNWRSREKSTWQGVPEPGQCCHEIIAGRLEPCAGCPVPEVLRTGAEAEGVVNTPDGGVCRIMAAPVHDELGNIVGVVETHRDITEKRRLAEQLQQSRKMESVGQLAAGVAHDVNNNLQVILGYNEMLVEAVPTEDHEAHTYLAAVRRSGEQARDVARNLLTFSRKYDFRTEPLDLGTIVSNQATMLRRLLGDHVSVHVEVAPDLPVAVADCSQVEQILLNLCLNARDAMPDGGRIDLKVTSVTLDEQEKAGRGVRSAGTFVLLSVTDQGHGIPPELHDRVFDPFFTTKDVDRGTGLGLATVYGVVHSHGGFVELESKPGRGTTFRVGLPAAVDATPGELVLPGESVAITPARILVVEDNQDVRQLSAAILRREGHHVEHVGDGAKALEILLEHGGRFDLVLIDVLLTGLNGWLLYVRVRARHADLPVIFCSGQSPALLESQIQADLSGQVFLQKPFDPQELINAVHRQLADLPRRSSVVPDSPPMAPGEHQ